MLNQKYTMLAILFSMLNIFFGGGYNNYGYGHGSIHNWGQGGGQGRGLGGGRGSQTCGFGGCGFRNYFGQNNCFKNHGGWGTGFNRRSCGSRNRFY